MRSDRLSTYISGGAGGGQCLQPSHSLQGSLRLPVSMVVTREIREACRANISGASSCKLQLPGEPSSSGWLHHRGCCFE
eukprot:scaffold192989_cov22-Tisochrysis_lutea.AAC.1